MQIKPDPIKIQFKNDIPAQKIEKQEHKVSQKVIEPKTENSEFGFDEDDEANDKVEELKETNNFT